MSLSNDYMINEFKRFFPQPSSPSSPSLSSSPSSPSSSFKSNINDLQRLAWVGTLCKEGSNIIYN